MSRPRLLDLFCGAGGAAMGYYRAGFDVVGVDINPQPRYPFEFHQGDAMTWPLDGYDVIHASPPCQAYSRMNRLIGPRWGRRLVHEIVHMDLLPATRERLVVTGLPYVIENVEGSPIRASIMLCGTMFGLKIRKHRWFETGWFDLLMAPASCGDHSQCYDPWRGAGRTQAKMQEAMGIDWMGLGGGASRLRGDTGDLMNAIPPAYTEWIGRQLQEALRVAA